MAHKEDDDNEPRVRPRPPVPVRVSPTVERGRGLVATRDISKGEEILWENPLVWGKPFRFQRGNETAKWDSAPPRHPVPPIALCDMRDAACMRVSILHLA